jgi:hypothetical protein
MNLGDANPCKIRWKLTRKQIRENSIWRICAARKQTHKVTTIICTDEAVPSFALAVQKKRSEKDLKILT